jgi:hypothetical protein
MLSVTTTRSAENLYTSPAVGGVAHVASIPIDLTTLTTDEIDANGWLKPGIPFRKLAGANAGLVAATQFVFGVTIAAAKVSTGNTAPIIAAAGVQDVAVLCIGMINRAAAEAILGRVYTAAEIAGFNLAGSKLVLLQ